MTTKILVVDDEQLYRHLIKVNLESEGYEINVAKDGEEALELVSARVPDLIILDVAMPRLDGFTTCERIRQFSDVPIIMLTARGDEQDRVRGLNVGADDYVLKPFSATELVARVRAVLRRSGEHRDRLASAGGARLPARHAGIRSAARRHRRSVRAARSSDPQPLEGVAGQLPSRRPADALLGVP